LAVVIMAAGKGTRMKSDLPKVLHQLAGRPMVCHVLEMARELAPDRVIVIVGYRKEMVSDVVEAHDVTIVTQDDPQGTGHAILQTERALAGFSGDVLILSGDVPLLPASVLEAFVEAHQESDAWLTVMTADLDDPTGYGRIVRGRNGFVTGIVEEKDADDQVRRIKEFNSGIYLMRSDNLFDRLRRIGNDNAKHEYYLTDIVRIAVSDGVPVAAFRVDDASQVLGVNTIEELRDAEHVLNARLTAGDH